MNVELNLRIAGALQIALAVAHAPFPRWFNWKEELARLSLLNRQIFLVHNLFIVLVLVLFGGLSLFAADMLVEPSRLAPLVCGGIGLFWAARVFAQFFVYDRGLWRGSVHRTWIHVAVSVLWCYLTSVYGVVLARLLWGGV